MGPSACLRCIFPAAPQHGGNLFHHVSSGAMIDWVAERTFISYLIEKLDKVRP